MGFDFVAPVTVEAEAFTCRVAVILILADDFDQPVEAAEEQGLLAAQVEQDVVVCLRFGEMVDDDRGNRRKLVGSAAMGEEADGRCAPQQLDDLIRSHCVGCVNHDAPTLLQCLGAETASGLVFIGGVSVEIDLGHILRGRGLAG